ncbi:MAG: hypothetical protein ABSC19_15930 [Syntrophorhabdales bacterium]|jgi:hypothetical protein
MKKRRGVHYTEAALKRVDESAHQLRSPCIFGSREAQLSSVPESLLLRDGTAIIVDRRTRNPLSRELAYPTLIEAGCLQRGSMNEGKAIREEVRLEVIIRGKG